jgi:hypothetical protein
MALSQGLTTTFKQNCLSGLENFAVGTPYTYKIALYSSTANLSNYTTAYTVNGEITGTGYTPGGKVLTVIPPAANNTSNTVYVSFANVTWNPASFTCGGALIYNSTTNASVCVLNFGSNKTAANTFTITFPADTSSDAVIRFS